MCYIYFPPEKKAWSKQLLKHAKHQAFNYEIVNIKAKQNEFPKQKKKVIVS